MPPRPRPLVLTVALLAIAARLDAAPGDPVGVEFQVNTYTTDRQSDPSVAPDGAGGFVVVWESPASDGDTDDDGIRARRFDAAGTPVGGEFQVNTYTTGDQFLPTVIANGDTVGIPWNSVVYVFTWNSSPTGVPVASKRRALMPLWLESVPLLP